MEYFAGLDFGTSGVKIAVAGQNGETYFTSENYPLFSASPGFAEENPEDLWQALCRGLKRIKSEENADIEKVGAIGFSGQMHGIIVLDENKNVIRPAIIHCDSRAEKYKAVFSNRELIENGIINRAFSGFQALSLLWIKENEPQNFNKIRYILSPKDYIRFKLTGALGTEITDASATLLFDVVNLHWSSYMTDKLGIDKSFLQKVSSPFDIAGEVSLEASSETGFKEGTAVVFGGADQAMGAIGAGALKNGDCTLTLGSGGQLLFMQNAPVYTSGLLTNVFCAAEEKMWYQLGAMLTAGTAFAKFSKMFYGESSYAMIDKEIESSFSKNSGLLFFPFLSGERSPYMNEKLRGGFEGISLSDGRAQYMRAVMEGICFSFRNISENIEGFSKTEKIIASGGFTNSPLWLSVMSAVLNKPLYVPKMGSAAAALGAAAAAAFGTKSYSSLKEARDALAGNSYSAVYPETNLSIRMNEKYLNFKRIADKKNTEAV